VNEKIAGIPVHPDDQKSIDEIERHVRRLREGPIGEAFVKAGQGTAVGQWEVYIRGASGDEYASGPFDSREEAQAEADRKNNVKTAQQKYLYPEKEFQYEAPPPPDSAKALFYEEEGEKEYTDLGDDVRRAIEDEAQELADASAAQAWSTANDIEYYQEQDPSIEDVWVEAEFGNYLAVNGDLVLPKEPERKMPEGFVLSDFGGRIPVVEEEVQMDFVIESVAGDFGVPVEAVKEVADYEGYKELHYVSCSGDSDIYVKHKAKETSEDISKKTAQVEDDENLLRDVDVGGFRLQMWDTGRQDSYGKSRIRYKFSSSDGKVLFEGDDFRSSPMHGIDSDEAVRALLGFLTLKPGDTDAEYFKDYTKEQMDFAQTHGENLSMYSMDPADMGDSDFEAEPLPDWKGPKKDPEDVGKKTAQKEEFCPHDQRAWVQKFCKDSGAEESFCPLCKRFVEDDWSFIDMRSPSEDVAKTTAALVEENEDVWGAEEGSPECPGCGGPGVVLGTLGNRAHFRCRNCGMDFSHEDAKGSESWREMQVESEKRSLSAGVDSGILSRNGRTVKRDEKSERGFLASYKGKTISASADDMGAFWTIQENGATIQAGQAASVPEAKKAVRAILGIKEVACKMVKRKKKVKSKAIEVPADGKTREFHLEGSGEPLPLETFTLDEKGGLKKEFAVGARVAMKDGRFGTVKAVAPEGQKFVKGEAEAQVLVEVDGEKDLTPAPSHDVLVSADSVTNPSPA
jgi:hypothetical protein